jgi:hypothetical protein
MRKFLVFAVFAVLAIFPTGALANQIDKTKSTVGCTGASVMFVHFTSYDYRYGIDNHVAVDGREVAFKHVPAGADLSRPIVITYPAPKDTASHVVVVRSNWATGHDSFTGTISNCTKPAPTPPAPPASHPSPPPISNVVNVTTVVNVTVTSGPAAGATTICPCPSKPAVKHRKIKHRRHCRSIKVARYRKVWFSGRDCCGRLVRWYTYKKVYRHPRVCV